MKRTLSLALVAVLLWGATAAELKIATVDLQKLTTEYYKARTALKTFKEREDSFVKELDRLRLEGRRLAKEAEDLQQLAANNALSPSERQEKKKTFELKLTDLRSFEIRYDDFRAQTQAELQNAFVITQKQILEDILTATRRIGEKEGFNLVLNANKANPAASDILFSRNIDDVTEKILAALNATKPAEAAPPKN